LVEAPLGEGRIRERVGFLQGTADPGPHGLGKMFEDVARFVDLMPISA
jgi:hypothetical protein